MKPCEMTEAELAELWRRASGRRPLELEGESWEVAYPGRRPGQGGPDFQGALLAGKSGQLLRGDVEAHRLSSLWRAHGHHRDPAYNDVILHLVAQDDTHRPIRLENGQEVPTLALDAWIGEADLPSPEVAAASPRPDLGLLLDRAGGKRLEEKAACFYEEMGDGEGPQVLYRGLLGALGYAGNKDAFRNLADRVPLRQLEGYIGNMEDEEAVAQAEAFLLGAAGLLPSQRELPPDHPWERCLELARARCGGEVAIPVPWLRWGRPGNHPARRLAGAARMAVGFRRQGLLEGLKSLLEKGSEARVAGELSRGLKVEADDYWRCHLCPGTKAPGDLGALVGLGRAREMAVNIVLPFFLAWARREGRHQLAERCLKVYKRHPKLPDNGLLGQVRACLGPALAGALTSACRQQGLLHLERNVCYQGGCRACPLKEGNP
ncbi:MAG: DUF2851 family protein [Chloroflexi bacterium]|nr:DUF2851 family protein [Chloroflexota bacterium]